MLGAKAFSANARDPTLKLRDTRLSIPTGNAWLDGRLRHAPNVKGLAVVLSSGIDPDSPDDPTDGMLAALEAGGLAILTLDLLTRHEQERDPDAAFNIPQMANRSLAAAEWISHQPELSTLPVALIASGTASAAAVRAAWKAPGRFRAIVCLAGRPDLAGAQPLRTQTAPIRIIMSTSDADRTIIETAAELIGAEHDLRILGHANVEDAIPLALDWLVPRLSVSSESEGHSSISVDE